MSSLLMKGFDIDLVVIITVCLIVFHHETGAGLFAFCQGLLIDIISGGILGLYSLTYVLVYLFIRAISHPIDIFSSDGRFAIIFIAVIFKEMLVLTFLLLFSMESPLWVNDLFMIFLSGLCTSIISLFIFHFLGIIEKNLLHVDTDISR